MPEYDFPKERDDQAPEMAFFYVKFKVFSAQL